MAAIRARDDTTLYVATEDLPDLDAEPPGDSARTARQVLETVLASEGGESSATETIRTTLADDETLPMLVSGTTTPSRPANRQRYPSIAERALGGDLAGRVVADPTWPALCQALISAETARWSPHQLLSAVAALGQLDTAPSAAGVLAARIDDYVAWRDPAPPRPADGPPAVDSGTAAGRPSAGMAPLPDRDGAAHRLPSTASSPSKP